MPSAEKVLSLMNTRDLPSSILAVHIDDTERKRRASVNFNNVFINKYRLESLGMQM